MRNKKRIKVYRDLILQHYPTFIKLVPVKKNFTRRKVNQFYKRWKEDPDLRLFQAMYNYGYLEYDYGYYTEGYNWFIKLLKIPPERVLLWGQNYDKNLKKLPHTKWILIKDMSKSHILAILRDIADNKIILPNRLHLDAMLNVLYNV